MSDHIERKISGYVERPQMAGYGRLKIGRECDTIDITTKNVAGMNSLGATGWVPASRDAVKDMANINRCRISGGIVDIPSTVNVAAAIGRSK
jgi:hypothetical protein